MHKSVPDFKSHQKQKHRQPYSLHKILQALSKTSTPWHLTDNDDPKHSRLSNSLKQL
eukprot:c26504_g1_i4 orf=197-367(-)